MEMQPVASEAGRQESEAKPKLVQQETTALAQIPLSELRNPFSLRHEKHEEENPGTDKGKLLPADPGTETTKQEGAEHRLPSEPAGPSVSASEWSKTAEGQATVNLRGILYGESRHFAILAAGSKSASLAEGESFAGWQVQKIEQQGVLLLGPQGEKYLRLLHSDHHSD